MDYLLTLQNLLVNHLKKENKMIEIFKSADLIKFKKNDIFLHFTGNVFGIGCSAFSTKAIKKIIDLKQRDESKGLVLLFSSFEQAKKYRLPQLNNHRILSLLNQYLPGNVTAVLHTDDKDFEHIAIENKLAFRIPNSKILRDFIDKIGTPILSTSINVTGQTYCSDLNLLQKQFSDWFDYGLYDENEKAGVALPSTLFDFNNDVNGDLQLICLREGSVPFSEIRDSWSKPLIQFVCVGNICRSPIAEYYLRKRIEEENLPYRTASCGLSPTVNVISEHSKKILESQNLNAENRLSILVNEVIIRQSAVLLCMSKHIKKHLVDNFPDAVNKVFTFAEFTGNSKDIDDPYGLDYSHYNKAWELIKKYSEDLVIRIKDYL